MFSKRLTILLAMLLILSLASGLASAAKAAKEPPLSPVEQDANLANSIAKILGFSVDSDKVTALREKHYSYGDIAMVYSISHISRKASWDILAMRDSKMGWGQIAKQLGVSVGQGLNGVEKIMKEMRMPEETEKLKDVISKEPKAGKK